MAQTATEPFQFVGATALIAANAVAPTGVQVVGDTATQTLEWKQYRIYNGSNQTVFIGASLTSAAAAASAAVIPTNATVGGGFPVPPGAIEVISARAGQFWSAIVATNTNAAALFVSVGKGA